MKLKQFIIGITVCIFSIIPVLCLFMPIKTTENTTIPAVVISDGNLQIENTNLTIDGTWSRSLVTPSCQKFVGKIQIDMLEYTFKEDGWNLNFQVTDEAATNYLSGGFFYNSNSDFEGYGWIYTNKNHDYYVLVTNQFNSLSDDYIVIAPAETKEAAKHICDVIGLNYLQN